MKQTMKYLSMAALVVMGAVMAGCAKEEPAAEENNIVTLTVSVGFSEDESTKALNVDYGKKTVVKTFAEGDRIAVIYKKGENTIRMLSSYLPAGNYGKSATFTVPLYSPNENSPIRIIYPADMAKSVSSSTAIDNDDATINYAALGTQDGTLNNLASNFDVCTFDGALSGYELPSTASLTNRLAILSYTLYDGKGTADKADDEPITSSVTKLTISDGTNSYTINGHDDDGHIYATIRPTASANIELIATDGTEYYGKSLTGKTYAAGQFYNITNRMEKVKYFTINSSDDKVLFARGNLQATWDGSKWSWAFAANQWDYIGNAAGNTSINVNGTVNADNVTVDLFGWVGASNTTWSGDLGTTGNAAMHGICNITSTGAKTNYGKVTNEPLKSDWGNTIGPGWRTPTYLEWAYIFNTRESGSTANGTSNARYTHATINTDNGTSGVNGVILFPDGINVADGEATSWGSINSSHYDSSTWADATKCTSAQWTALAAKGCVFLPAAGWREGLSVEDAGNYGLYWSSKSDNTYSNWAYGLHFAEDNLDAYYPTSRNVGGSVRLIRVLN